MTKNRVYTVLVVEDEELIRNNLVKKINQAELGFEVIDAVKNGELAIEQVKNLSPDVVFTDIHMPKMDGITLCRYLYERYPHIQKVIISGYSEFSYAQAALRIEVKNYLIKPVKMESLIETLTHLRISLDAEFEKNNKLATTNKSSYVKTPEETVEEIKHFMIENIASTITIEAIAESFNFNISYLSKLFKKVVGQSPTQYLLELRMNKAKYLLLSQPAMSVRQISEILGFEDQHYFSRVFKNFTDQSPLQFRNDSQNKRTL